MKIPAAHYNRTSNAQVLESDGQLKARMLLLQQQLGLYGKLVRLLKSSLLRKAFIIPDGVRPGHFNLRKKGRPRSCWHDQVYRHVLAADASADLIWNTSAWKRCVKGYVAGIN